VGCFGVGESPRCVRYGPGSVGTGGGEEVAAFGGDGLLFFEDRQVDGFRAVDGFGCRAALVGGPVLAALGAPRPGEPGDGFVEVWGGEVDVAGVAIAAHRDIRELSTAAVLENVGGVDGGALGAMGRHGVGVGEPIGTGVLTVEAQLPAVAADGVDGPVPE
jgi:hypothetical protein